MKKRKVIEAIAEKINNIVNESNGKLTVNKIASKSCLTQSTVQHIMDKSYKDVKLLTIVRLCDGLGLTLKEFFSDEHSLLSYYTSSLVYSKLLDLFDDLIINEKFWRYRYHLLMIYKYLVTRNKVWNKYRR